MNSTITFTSCPPSMMISDFYKEFVRRERKIFSSWKIPCLLTKLLICCLHSISAKKTRKEMDHGKHHFKCWTNLCSVISINLDVTVGKRNGNDVEGNHYGMISSVFICYHSAGKLPFYICVSLKAEQFMIRTQYHSVLKSSA